MLTKCILFFHFSFFSFFFYIFPFFHLSFDCVEWGRDEQTSAEDAFIDINKRELLRQTARKSFMHVRLLAANRSRRTARKIPCCLRTAKVKQVMHVSRHTFACRALHQSCRRASVSTSSTYGT